MVAQRLRRLIAVVASLALLGACGGPQAQQQQDDDETPSGRTVAKEASSASERVVERDGLILYANSMRDPDALEDEAEDSADDVDQGARDQIDADENGDDTDSDDDQGDRDDEADSDEE